MSRQSFRFRYLLGLIAHAAIALVGSSRHGDPSHFHPEILASCGASPSFTAETELKRWERLPIDVYVDLDSLPEENRTAYMAGIERGVGLWAEATTGRIDAFRLNDDLPESPVHLSVVEEKLEDDALGGTELRFASNRIIGARVQIVRSDREGTAFLVHDVASTTAHEMGHVLGIVGHSSHPEDKMSTSGNLNYETEARDPSALLTPRDINTVAEAYCR